MMGEKETGRLEAFSDGVFAIAITLLIIEIKVPHLPPEAVNREVWGALWGLWPSFLALVMSFVSILIMWVNHHGLFGLVQRVDASFLFANGFLLLLITFVPFPTAVLADYLDRAAANTAAALYCGTYVLINLAYNLLWHTATHHRLLRAQVPAAHIQKLRRAYRLTLPVYVVAAALALFHAFVGLVVCSALWGVWAFLNYRPADSRVGGRRPSQGEEP
jgi:uncharacterized membrane protein